jgi:hypothetical protein
MLKSLTSRKQVIASGVFIAYQVFMTSLAVFGIIRLSIGLFQGECNNVSFGMLD